VVVDVVAAGVSFADLLQTQGRYQLNLSLPFTPGMDAAGVVRSAPPGAGVDAGQRVAVLMSHGCWQEVLTAGPRWVLPLPDDMSFEAGAAAPLNYLTGLFALVWRGRAQAGQTVLVHGGAGGVGVAAIQLGRVLGLRTIAVTSDERKRDFALRCGGKIVLSRRISVPPGLGADDHAWPGRSEDHECYGICAVLAVQPEPASQRERPPDVVSWSESCWRAGTAASQCAGNRRRAESRTDDVVRPPRMSADQTCFLGCGIHVGSVVWRLWSHIDGGHFKPLPNNCAPAQRFGTGKFAEICRLFESVVSTYPACAPTTTESNAGRRHRHRPRAALGFLLDSTAPQGKATYLAVLDSGAASGSAGRLALASRTRSCSDRYSW
ncbi:MAG: alcohol dehydrogenase catalytic domain-containing protein, partial [Pseudonocardiaceae bacterium]